MLDFLKNLFGGSSVDYAELVENGAVIVDVRTQGEYKSGHIKGSQNIPLNNLHNHLFHFKKEVPIITCCASGMRSSSAKNLLQSKGYTVYNGGGWSSLKHKLNR